MSENVREIEGELERLKSLGFRDWKVDKNGIRIRETQTREEISFPEFVYQENSLSREDFWSRYRVQVLSKELKKNQTKLLWEIGGGDGRISIPLNQQGIGVIAIEPLYAGCMSVASEGIPVFQGTLSDLRLPQDSIEAIGFFDVLEHIYNEKKFLEEVHEKVADSGLIYLTVPAHQNLFSEHDLALGHFRRYSKKNLARVLEDSGFEIVNCYWQSCNCVRIHRKSDLSNSFSSYSKYT